MFEEVTRMLLESRTTPELDAFLIGYMLAEISPGTMDHLHLLERIGPVLPASFLWYGAIAGLRSQVKFGSPQISGIGRKLMRELKRPEAMLSRPRSDIDFFELLVVGESVRAGGSIKGRYPGCLLVEILPGVASLYPLRGPEGSESNVDTVRRELRSIDRALLDLQVSTGRLSEALGLTPERGKAASKNSKRKPGS